MKARELEPSSNKTVPSERGIRVIKGIVAYLH